MGSFPLRTGLWNGMVCLLLAGQVCCRREGFRSDPGTPSRVSIQSISVNSMTLRVTFTEGIYTGLDIEIRSSRWQTVTKSVSKSGSFPGSSSVGVSFLSLLPGEQYTAKVRTKAGQKYSQWSSTSSPARIAPATPSRVYIQKITVNYVTLQVTFRAGIYSGLDIELRSSVGRTITKSITGSGSGSGSKTINVYSLSLVAGQQYTAKVRAKSGNKYSQWSPLSSQSRIAPVAPSGVSIQRISVVSVTLQVTFRNGYYSGLEVQLRSAGGGTVTKSVTGSGSGSGGRAITVNSLSLVAGERYTAKVRAKSGPSYSQWSPTSSQARTAPSTPSGVSIQSISVDSVTLQVSFRAGRYSGLEVEIRSGGGQTLTKSVTGSGSGAGSRAVTVNSLSLVAGEQYTAKVRVTLVLMYSQWSPTSSPARIAPSTPIIIAAVSYAAAGSIHVTWRRGPGIESRFHIRLTRGTTWERAEQTNAQEYIFTPLVSGQYTVTVKAQSGNLISKDSQPKIVEHDNSSVKVLLHSVTSRSLGLDWTRYDDPTVKSFILLVFNEDTCIQEIHLTEKNFVTPTYNDSCQIQQDITFDSSVNYFLHNVIGLLPYTKYVIDMYKQSEANQDISELATVVKTTNTEVPSKLNITSVSVGGPRNVTVCWSKPDPFPGPTQYTVTLVDQGEGQREQDRITMVTGYDTDCQYFDELDEFWEYSIKVSASTSAGGGPQTESIIFRTQPSVPGNVTDFSIKPFKNSEDVVDVTWRPPKLRDRNANITGFNLEYQNYENRSVIGSEATFRIPWAMDKIYSQRVAVEENDLYIFTIWVSSDTSSGLSWSIYYNHTINREVPEADPALSDNPVNGGMIAMGVVIAVLVVVFIVVGVILLRRRHLRRHQRVTDSTNNDDYATKAKKSNDPNANYESIMVGQMVIPETQIQLSDKMLGDSVSLGELLRSDGNSLIIAVRKCKGHTLKETRTEAEILRAISPHTNIINFLGYSIKTDCILMVTEFKVNGDLESYLRHHRGSSKPLTKDKTLTLGEQIASGMMHLSQQNIIHCDLRTHNVLISDLMVAKISGFQHAGSVEDENEVLIKPRIPSFRWMPLETMERKEFSVYSDIWSFGVTFWEIMTEGVTPYKGMKHAKVKQFIKQTYRLAVRNPVSAHYEPEERQSFENIVDRLRSQDLQHYVNVGRHENLGFEDSYTVIESKV